MTLSILMYGMMACALAALLAVLVVETRASRVNVSERRRRVAPASVRRSGRVRHDRDCPQGGYGSSSGARRAARSRERATHGSRRRWAA